MDLLLIDNYDSFTHNLAHLLENTGFAVTVVRNDALTADDLKRIHTDALCISPGPGKPAQAGMTMAALEHFCDTLPVLGVCLGMQAIGELYGCRTIEAPSPVHGFREELIHNGTGLLESIPSPTWVARYHSLAIDQPAEPLVIDAETSGKLPMAIHHQTLPVFGLQFHPESFLTSHGRQMMACFFTEVEKHREDRDG